MNGLKEMAERNCGQTLIYGIVSAKLVALWPLV